jgi:hypothetical protein
LKNKNSQLKNKKRQAYYIAPLQPLTLAAFPPWEGSAGAGRVRPAGRKYTEAETIIIGNSKDLIKG